MDSEANDEPMSGAAPDAVATSELWYCSHCTHLILPPGSQGALTAEGERFCQACSPFETGNPPATQTYDVTPPITELAAGRISARGRADYANGERRRGAASKGKMVWLAGSAAALILLAIGAVYLNSNKAGKVPAVAKADPNIMKTVVVGAIETPSDKARAPLSMKSGSGEKPAFGADQAPGGGLAAKQMPNDVGTDGARRAISEKGAVEAVAAKAIETKAAIPPANLRIEEFDARLKETSALLNAERYSDAQRLLTTLADNYGNAPWWEKRSKTLAFAQEACRERSDAYEQEARDALNMAKSADKKEMLDRLENEWKARLSLGEMTAKPAQRILDAVAASRERFSTANVEKRSCVFTEKFEKFEKRAKAKLAKSEIDEALKTLQELKVQMQENADLGQKFCDRWAALNFELSLSQSAERFAFHVEPSGVPAEIHYDFKDGDQFKAWKFEGDGSSSGSAAYDADGTRVLLNVSGEHVLDPRAGKRAPALTIPFYLNDSNWTFEADAAMLKVHNRDKRESLPYVGIMVSDGGANVIRIYGRESKKNELHLHARGAADEKDTTAHLTGKDEEKLHLKISAVGGRVYLSAYAGSGGAPKAVDVLRTGLTFKPRFLALFVESRDKEENATAAFSNVKLTGGIDKAKISAGIEARRMAEINAAKSEFGKLAKPILVSPKAPAELPQKK